MSIETQKLHLRSLSEALKDLVRLAADIEGALLARDVQPGDEDWIGIDRNLAFGTGPASVKIIRSRAGRLHEQPTFRDQIRFLVTERPISPKEIKERLTAEDIVFKVPRVHSALFALVDAGEIERLKDGSYRRATTNEGKT